MKDDSPTRVRSQYELSLLRFAKSGRLTPILIGLLCVGLLVAAILRGHGKIHQLRDAVDTTLNPPLEDFSPKVVGPGGQDPIKLTRSAIAIGKDVEFLSTTLLPGRSMSVLQMTAIVPGHGEVPLLIAPDVDALGNILTGRNDDEHGEASMKMGGAFLLPWAGRLSGSDTGRPGVLGSQWQGTHVTFPASGPDSTTSTDGLFLNLPASSVKSDVLPDGQYAQAVFHARDFNGNWPSTVDVTVTVEMSAHTVDLTVSAMNTGSVATPLGMGWHPLFAIPSGDRGNAELSIPSNTMLEVNRDTGRPSGRMVSTQGTLLDFSRDRGGRLGTQSIDATYTNLQPGSNGAHGFAEIRDPASNLSVKIVPLSSNITSLHVVAPADKKWISIEPATNLPDALSPVWKQSDGGLTTLAPGATMQWKVRVEISPIDTEDKSSR